MTKIEQKVLKSISQSLYNSTLTVWADGDMDKWVEYARKMKNVITASCNTIEGLIELPPEINVEDVDDKLTL
jgi:hypothetical protein